MATLCLCVLGGCLVQLSIASEMVRAPRPLMRINAGWRNNNKNASAAAVPLLHHVPHHNHSSNRRQQPPPDNEEDALLRFFRLLFKVMATETDTG